MLGIKQGGQEVGMTGVHRFHHVVHIAQNGMKKIFVSNLLKKRVSIVLTSLPLGDRDVKVSLCAFSLRFTEFLYCVVGS